MHEKFVNNSEVSESREPLEKKRLIPISMFGGSFNELDGSYRQKLQELGSFLSSKHAVLYTGPALASTYTGEIANGFSKKQRERRRNGGIVEFHVAQRPSFIKEATENTGHLTKSMHVLAEGVPNITNKLERPHVAVYLFVPSSATTLGTIAEAIQGLAHIETAKRTLAAAKKTPDNAIQYPVIPVAFFIDWPEDDRRIIEMAIRKSQVLSGSQQNVRGESEAVHFTTLSELLPRLSEVIDQQRGVLNEFYDKKK